jgi:hypothetical protein
MGRKTTIKKAAPETGAAQGFGASKKGDTKMRSLFTPDRSGNAIYNLIYTIILYIEFFISVF